MPIYHGVMKTGPRPPLPAFEFPSAAQKSAADKRDEELQELAKWQEEMKGTTSQVPQHLAHLQVLVVAPHLDLKTVMASVPAEPGSMDSADPFADPIAGMAFPNHAVVKIGNIPYAATKQEIVHFLGRDAQADMIDESSWGTPIHIIMERSTSKTMDCYVEMKTQGAAIEQFKRHWDTVTGGSSRPLRIGHRLVTVEVSTQDELMKDLFPRAKCVRWVNGQPTITKNTDPYSTGFRGYFTNEEMVGLVRHAEHPNRSPFSIKCLQRTYECMISTLWKFPWAARDTYTIGDRNTLFVTYMKLLDVLVYKVDQSNVVMLSHQLLLDYLFAGLNCRGFGERQRGLVHARGGRHAVPIQVLQIHGYWPFDIVSKRIGLNDEEYCKTYLNVIERGVQSFLPFQLMPKYFIHAPGCLPGGFEPPIRITHFEFNEQSQGLTFGAAIKIELSLMRMLLKTGYKIINGVYPGTYVESQGQERLAEEVERKKEQRIADTYSTMAATMARLKLQTEALNKEKMQPEPIKKDEQKEKSEGSPPQSPKSSLAAPETDVIDSSNDPVERGRRLFGKADTPEPRRRLSEPQPYTGTLGAGLDISPIQAASASKAVPIVDPKAKTYRTPTRATRRTSFAVGDTIHEESENED